MHPNSHWSNLVKVSNLRSTSTASIPHKEEDLRKLMHPYSHRLGLRRGLKLTLKKKWAGSAHEKKGEDGGGEWGRKGAKSEWIRWWRQ